MTDCDFARLGTSAASLVLHDHHIIQPIHREQAIFGSELAVADQMSRKANCWNNSPMESFFFKALKVERIYQVRYTTRARDRLDIVN